MLSFDFEFQRKEQERIRERSLSTSTLQSDLSHFCHENHNGSAEPPRTTKLIRVKCKTVPVPPFCLLIFKVCEVPPPALIPLNKQSDLIISRCAGPKDESCLRSFGILNKQLDLIFPSYNPFDSEVRTVLSEVGRSGPPGSGPATRTNRHGESADQEILIRLYLIVPINKAQLLLRRDEILIRRDVATNLPPGSATAGPLS